MQGELNSSPRVEDVTDERPLAAPRESGERILRGSRTILSPSPCLRPSVPRRPQRHLPPSTQLVSLVLPTSRLRSPASLAGRPPGATHLPRQVWTSRRRRGDSRGRPRAQSSHHTRQYGLGRRARTATQQSREEGAQGRQRRSDLDDGSGDRRHEWYPLLARLRTVVLLHLWQCPRRTQPQLDPSPPPSFLLRHPSFLLLRHSSHSQLDSR